jgi:pSer/pThr/pTyr-binding forkhead associated (FHA) protein
VGRFHARLYYRQGRLTVEDNDSLNKTYVDGVAITAPTVLNPGQHLRLGLDVPVEVEFVELDPFGLPR